MDLLALHIKMLMRLFEAKSFLKNKQNPLQRTSRKVTGRLYWVRPQVHLVLNLSVGGFRRA